MNANLLTYSEDEREHFRASFPDFSANLLKINPKIKELIAQREAGDKDAPRGQLIPFRWNKAQRRVWKEMCAMIAAGVPIKLVVLKARQVGISTFFCAFIFWLMWRQKYTRAAIVAFEKKTTLAELNETMATFYDALPAGYKPELRQARRGGRVGKEDMYFRDRKSNLMFVVQSDGALRGVARDAVLTTEVSFYDEPEEFYGGFLPSMSDGPSSLLVLESSPEDGYFKDRYLEAKAGKTDRRAIFIPWWMCDDLYFRRLVKRGRKLYDERSGREAYFPKVIRAKQAHLSKLAARENLPPISDEQMWWWMCYCDENYSGDEEFMGQEFPDDDVTAFQRRSRSAFKSCLAMVNITVAEADDVFPEQVMGTLRSPTYTNPEIEEQRVEFIPEPRPGYIDQERRAGFLMLEPPQAGHTYVIGADVADEEGEEDEEGERAFSVGDVYCCDCHEQAGEWRGHIHPIDWGDQLVMLGYLYNTALLVVERNNMGRLTENRIMRDLQYPDYRLYKWPDWNVGLQSFTKKKMWETNLSTKPMMIGTFLQWVRDGMFKVRTAGLQDEMEHYRVVHGLFKAKDRPADRIIAASLCVMGAVQTDFFRERALVGATARIDRSAHGMAARILRTNKVARPSPSEVPAELDEMGVSQVVDIFAAAGL